MKINNVFFILWKKPYGSFGQAGTKTIPFPMKLTI